MSETYNMYGRSEICIHSWCETGREESSWENMNLQETVCEGED
jgi:hypothetical protein